MRHAVYFTPEPSSALHRLGSTWLGRDALTGEDLPQPDKALRDMTVSARRYGLHGTLKPPFRLKDGASVAGFQSSLRRLAAQHAAFETPQLVLADLDGFLALRLASLCPELDHLAAECVERLDDFRAAPTDEELRKRRAAGLTATQDDLLQRWGYPYVFEEFRFHITLTDRLDDNTRAWARKLAEHHFAEVLVEPLAINSLTHMTEPADGEAFRATERMPLVRKSMRAA